MSEVQLPRDLPRKSLALATIGTDLSPARGLVADGKQLGIKLRIRRNVPEKLAVTAERESGCRNTNISRLDPDAEFGLHASSQGIPQPQGAEKSQQLLG